VHAKTLRTAKEVTELTSFLSLAQVIAACIGGYLTLLNGFEFSFLIFINNRKKNWGGGGDSQSFSLPWVKQTANTDSLCSTV
jgi:hypothetical protein